MKSQDVLKLLEKKDNLPVLPQLFYRIVKAASDPDTKVSELSNLILEDQVLTGRVLRMANSAYYAMPQKISTVTRAIMVLGFISLKNFITAVTVVEALNSERFRGGLFEAFWIHALACGLCASFIAEKLKVAHREEAMIAGLVHDCGKLFLDHHFPEAYGSVKAMIQQGKDILVAEKKAFGLTHVEVGERIADQWNLPASLVEAIRDHHRLSRSREDLRLSDIVFLANLLSSHTIPQGWKERFEWMPHRSQDGESLNRVCSDSGMPEESVQEIVRMTEQHIEQVAQDLNLRFLGPSAEERPDSSPELFHLQREMERKERQLAMVNEISVFLGENPRPEELIQVVVEAVHRGIGFNRTLLFLLNTADSTVDGRLGLGHDIPPFLRKIRVPMGSDGLMGRAMRERKAFNIVDAASPSYSHLPSLEVSSLAEIRAFAVVPFMAGTEVIGLVMVDNMITGEPIRDKEVDLIRTFLTMAGFYLAGCKKKAGSPQPVNV